MSTSFQLPKQLNLEPETFSAINAAERALTKWSTAASSGLQPGFKDYLAAQEWISSAELAGVRFIPGDGLKNPITSAADVVTSEKAAWLSLYNLTHFRSFMASITPPAGLGDSDAERNFLAGQLPQSLRQFAFPMSRDAKEISHEQTPVVVDESRRKKLEQIFSPDVWDKYMSLTPLVAVGMRYAAVFAIAPYGAYTGPILRATVNRDLGASGLVNGDGSKLGLSRAFVASGDYHKTLEAVKGGEFGPWIRTFARSTERSASEALQKLGEVRTAKAGLMEQLPGQRRAELLADYLSSVPHLNLMDMSVDLGIAYNTCSTHVRNFEKKGNVEELIRTERGQWYASRPAIAALAGATQQMTRTRKPAGTARIENDAPLPEERKAATKHAVKSR